MRARITDAECAATGYEDVMAISVISISSDSSEDSVGTPAGRVILFGTIPTTIPDTTPVITPPATQTDTLVIPTETPIIAPTIPPSPDYTPAYLDYSLTSDSESDPYEDPSSDHILPLPATSPFLSSDNDPTDSDTPSSPTHDTPFTEITASTQRSPIIPRRRVMLLASGQPIPHGRPYRYCDTPASSVAICFFRGYLLLPRLFTSFVAICFFHDVSLYLLGEMCEMWTLLGLSSSD
ncbi:hypothetical protein Tco_1015581 [Tanacetum coccineum]|uniref:Uncharacterized protein n=1 Tax=Tanacetum coccineum TaxID=301880 RepID=A0ABQ5FL67_9ASTR